MLLMLAGSVFGPGLGSRIDSLLADSKLDGAVVSVTITDGMGQSIYGRNSQIHIVPASNMKLLSNSFALHMLGPDFRPQTQIWKRSDRTVVESTGDPLLTHRQLVAVREELHLDRRLPVFVHEEYFPLWHGNWEVGDLPNKYAAPVCAFTVDRGAFELWSQNRRLRFEPESYGTRIRFEHLPKGLSFRYDPFTKTEFIQSGAVFKDGSIDTLSLPHPDECAAQILGSRMVRTEVVPNSIPDKTIVGASIIEVVDACLPPSDNQLAEQLLMLGARSEGPLGDDAYATAQKRLTNFLTRTVGIPTGDINVDDGSGLSRHNFVTTRALTTLLAWAGRQPTALQWRQALAHSGTGTLAHRLQGVRFTGKTGSLDMVAALSGYVETEDHQTRIVSIVVNEYSGSASDVRKIMDKVVEEVAKP